MIFAQFMRKPIYQVILSYLFQIDGASFKTDSKFRSKLSTCDKQTDVFNFSFLMRKSRLQPTSSSRLSFPPPNFQNQLLILHPLVVSGPSACLQAVSASFRDIFHQYKKIKNFLLFYSYLMTLSTLPNPRAMAKQNYDMQ